MGEESSGWWTDGHQIARWKLEKDPQTEILTRKGRVKNYQPIYLGGGYLCQKLIQHVHNQIMHLGVSNTTADVRETWWIPKLREKVKKAIHKCNVCRLYSTKPFEAQDTAEMPSFRTEGSRPFEVTALDFAGPLLTGVSKNGNGKCYILIFTCAASRAIHLEVTRSQTAEEFQRKLNAFISRRSRPRLIISDNALTFKVTAEWVKKIRKSEILQNHLANEEITWQFNLAKSPWWGGFYERLIKEIKKTLYKTLGRSHLSSEEMEQVIMDIERYLNNQPLTYVECELETQVLTPNVIMLGGNAYPIEDTEENTDELTAMNKRLVNAKQHAWQRWKKEYVHALMEVHRSRTTGGRVPEVIDILLIIGDSKNRGEWKKGRVERLVKGKDGVVRGVVLLHNGKRIERPLQLVCPWEIKAIERRKERVERKDIPKISREKRQAAKKADQRIRAQLSDEDD